MSVLIGGGSGFVGTALINVLKAQGVKTRIITRKPNVIGTLTWDELAKKGLPEGTSAVINLAGANLSDFMKSWKGGYKEEVHKSRIDTTKQLADAITKAKPTKPKVFIQTSAVGFYPPSETTEYTENSPGGDNTDVFTKLCRSWESAGELPQTLDVRRVILRFGIVLGRSGGLIKNLYLPFFFGMGGPMGSGRQWLPWIHIDDLTGLIIHAIKNDNVKGVLNAVAPNPVTSAEFAKAFAQAMNRPALFGTPEFVVKLLFDEDRAKMVLTGQKVIPKRTLESGYQFKYPDIKSACKALV